MIESFDPVVVRNGQSFVCRRLGTNKNTSSLRSLPALSLSKGVSAVKFLMSPIVSQNLASFAALREASFLASEANRS